MAFRRLKPLPTPTNGGAFPIGATLVTGGANFCVFSRSAASIELLLLMKWTTLALPVSFPSIP